MLTLMFGLFALNVMCFALARDHFRFSDRLLTAYVQRAIMRQIAYRVMHICPKRGQEMFDELAQISFKDHVNQLKNTNKNPVLMYSENFRKRLL